MERRVVITGMGVVSCIGNDVRQFWKSLLEGRCGVGPITRFDASQHKARIAGEVKDFDITKYMPEKDARRLDLFCQYAVAAADEAMADAGLAHDLSGVDANSVGVLVSSGIGGLRTLEDQCALMAAKGPSRVSPLMIPMMIIDLASGNIALRYGAKGPNMGVVTACATAGHSIGESYWMVRRGDADIMIAGGAEATITPIAFAGFASMKALSHRNDDPLHASRPFDAERDGFVMSEGAGVLILEEYEHAKRRGAQIHAEVVGYGATADAYHITSPSPDGEGAARAMRRAMNRANISPEDVNYYNAHGTSTPLNDKYETLSVKAAFGSYSAKLPISSIKGATGHSLGAAGGLEAIVCAMAIKENVAPPTINYEHPDADCDLDYIPNTPRPMRIDCAMSVNLGFGGHNVALIFKRM